MQIYANTGIHWSRPVEATLTVAHDAFQKLMEVGDMSQAGYSFSNTNKAEYGV